MQRQKYLRDYRTLLPLAALAIALVVYLLVARLAPAGGPTPAGNSNFVTRSGSRLLLHGHVFRFAGPNIPWLGLDQQGMTVAYPSRFRVNDALATAEDMGATVVRAHTLGISVGCSACVEPALGRFNTVALAHIDYAIAAARAHGLRLIIPLTDDYRYYHGGRCQFTDWRGLTSPADGPCDQDARADAFYTDARVRADFEQYIAHLLIHVNRYTGVAYKDDPTILAWELGNELDTSPAGVGDELVTWSHLIAAYIKRLDPRHLVADGYAWSGGGKTDLADSAIDLYTLHSYPRSIQALRATATAVARSGKAFFVGEFDWTSHGGDALAPYLSALQRDPAIAGDLYWSLWPHADTYGYEEHSDGYTLTYPGTNAAMQRCAALLRRHAYAIATRSVPPEAVPGAPLITAVTPFSLAWRGSAGAATYTIARASRPRGSWTVLCLRCATDSATPWRLPHPAIGTVWYRVTPVNLAGVAGRPSPPRAG